MHRAIRYVKQKAWPPSLGFIIVVVLFAALWVQVISQLYYPYDTALPRAALFGKNVAHTSRVELSAQLQKKFEGKKVTLKTPTSSETVPLSSFGASIDADAMSATLTNYPVWQRFIPLSLYWSHPSITAYDVHYDAETFAAQSEAIAKKLSVSPVDANLAFTDGKLVVTNAKEGESVTAESVSAAVKKTQFQDVTKPITVEATQSAPTRTDASIEPALGRAQAAVNRQYTLRLVDGTEVTPSKQDITAWLKLQSTDASIELAVDPAAMRTYSDSLSKKYGTNPTSSVATVVDGVETSRVAGQNGSMIAANDLIAKLTNAVNSAEPGVIMDVLMQPVAPPVTYQRSYTSSEAGLRAYVAYTTSTQNVAISLAQLDGAGWSASGRGDESRVSASEYKLYVALWLFDQMDQGKIHWNDPWLDTTVSGCFDRMTIASTNPCAEAWIDAAGRTNLNNFIYAHGFSRGTTFVNPTAAHTTANDLAKYMRGLNDGSLVAGAHRDRLLHSLSVQPYRTGIPKGSSGAVWDKVGFLWDYVNDAAIVKTSKGSYVLVVMTKGAGGYGKIATITRELERIMYP